MSRPRRHRYDPRRESDPNRWFGGDTCRCACGCGFLALGKFFNKPLCSHCERNEPGWMRAESPS